MKKWENCLPRRWENYLPDYWEITLPKHWEKYLTFTGDSLQEEITYYERLNSQYQPAYITGSTIESYRKEMEKIFVGINVQEQRNFLKKFIEKIIVKDEGIEIVYYTPGVKFPSLAFPGA